jgi:hypothetical protein
MSARRTISIVAMSRPHLFRRLLESLTANDLDGWKIVVRIEPTDLAPEFEAIAAEALDCVEYDLKVNDRVLGITFNPFQAIEDAFASGATLNLHLEEDFVVSHDVTALAVWYEREYRSNWLCLSLLAGPCGSAGFLSNAAYADLLFEARTFNSIGFAIRREEWFRYARDAWQHDKPPRSRVMHANWRFNWGWDWSLYGLVAEGDLRTVQPVLGRATHTGREGGTYASPEFHDAAFSGLAINQQRRVSYRLTSIDELPHDVRGHALLQDEITTMRMQMEQVALDETGGLTTTLSGHRQHPAIIEQPRRGLWQRLFGRS